MDQHGTIWGDGRKTAWFLLVTPIMIRYLYNKKCTRGEVLKDVIDLLILLLLSC